MSSVELSGIRKTYGAVQALAEVDLEIEAGQFVTLLGPSGSGKTTLLNIVSGMVEATAGSIHIAGKDVTNVPPGGRDLGMVFQNYALMPHMSVFENVAFPLRIRKMPRDEIARQVAEVLDVVQLGHLADRKPKELSGGQQQRVSIARCLVYRPELILMDEPLGALDKKLREQLQLEIKRIHQDLRVTVLYVTHDQEEALVLSDKICVMNEGRIEQEGSPAELYFRPQTEFIADFLGESNILEGKVVQGKGSFRVITFNDTITVQTDFAEALSENGKARFLIRPESISVTKSEPDKNAIQAKIVDRIFSGESSRLYLQAPSGLKLIAKSYSRFEGEDFSVGDDVYASFRPIDCRPIVGA